MVADSVVPAALPGFSQRALLYEQGYEGRPPRMPSFYVSLRPANCR